jgi:hypothetical protein
VVWACSKGKAKNRQDKKSKPKENDCNVTNSSDNNGVNIALETKKMQAKKSKPKEKDGIMSSRNSGSANIAKMSNP